MSGIVPMGTGVVLAACVLFVAVGSPPSRAQGLRQDPPGFAAALPESAYDAAKSAFERLSDADRLAIQDALVWTGDYASTADGTFGRRTFEAIQSYQRGARQMPSGILDRPAMAALLAGAARARTAQGFQVITDAPSGVRIGLPGKLLPKRSPNPNGGTRFQSQDGRVTLDTRVASGGGDQLKEIYERNLAIQTPGRTVSYRLLRPDFFVVSGETPSGRFYSRYAQRGDVIRAFSIGYDKALAADLDRIVIAIANSFVPFPDTPAASVPGIAATPMPPRLPEGARPAPASYSGLAVAPRRVLAPAGSVEGCPEPLVDGAPAKVVTADRGRGLALLDLATPHRIVPITLAPGAPEGGALVVFIAPGEGGKAVAAPAEIATANRLYAPLQDGAAGGVVLDRAGDVAGMVSALASGTRAVAGLVPPASHTFASVAELRRLLGADAPQARPAGPRPGGLGPRAADIAPALVRITCAASPRQP